MLRESLPAPGRRTALGAAGLAVVMGHSGRAGAQGTPTLPRPDERVIVTANAAPVTPTSLSRSVTILSRDDLDRMGVSSIVEGLRLMPGVDVRARGPRDIQSDFSIRGSTFGQALVLIDGFRLNDSQTGHHDGEIPMTVAGLDRIEVVDGAGSSVHGADALGGTIHVISRTGPYATASLAGGQFGYVDAQASVAGRGIPAGLAITGWGSRSGGFTFDREFAQGGVAVRGSPARGLTIDVRHQRRAFGANGFYGASPSKEWTDMTLAGATWQRDVRSWLVLARGAVRHHDDRFRWDIARPGFAENLHHTNAAEATLSAARDLPRNVRLTVGGSAGGDWIQSSNLQEHRYGRGGAFGELLWQAHARATLVAGVRADDYSAFGAAVNPAVSGVVRVGERLRLRASAARAFRIPTFTELYYTDPNNIGTATLRPEHGWTLDGGGDWTSRAWTGSLSLFRRWDENVIDWIKSTPAEPFHATNVRDVTSTGFEASLTRQWHAAFLRLYYAGLTVDAPGITAISKYVLEYARHQSGGSLSLPVTTALRVSVNVDHRHRVDGQSYDLVSLRLSRTLGRATAYVDGTNLFDETYHEIAGVDMPGRWLTIGLTLR
jgi:iron complex outermembrane receptor protein